MNDTPDITPLWEASFDQIVAELEHRYLTTMVIAQESVHDHDGGGTQLRFERSGCIYAALGAMSYLLGDLQSQIGRVDEDNDEDEADT